MFYNHHFIGMHWIWWISLTVLILLFVFDIIPYRGNTSGGDNAMEILRKRFARGEIEREEFEERKRILNQDQE